VPTTYRHEVRRLVQLAWPLVLAQVSAMTLWVVDVLMLGALGVEQLDAASIGRVWIWGTLVFAMGVVLGIDPIASQAHGAEDDVGLTQVRHRGVVLAFVLGPLVAITWLFTGPALRLMGQDEVLIDEAVRYVYAQLPGALFFLLYIVYRHWLQAQGLMKPILWVTLSANVLNAVVDWVLIFGHWGAPAMGVAGAGVATAATLFYMMAGLAWASRRQDRDRRVPNFGRTAFEPVALRRILGLGAPVGVQISLEYWAFSITTLWAGLLGIEALGAHTIAITLASLTFMVPMGFSFAAATRVGNLVGAGDTAQAQRAAWVSLALGGGVIAVTAGLPFWIGREAFPALFTQDAGVIALAATILPVMAAFQLFDGIQVVGAAVLRGMGRTLPSALFALLGFYALALPAAWWLGFRANRGVAGIWWGLALGLAAVAVMLIVYIARRGPGRISTDERSLPAAERDTIEG
jgi:MATE family multidrug resistance protein